MSLLVALDQGEIAGEVLIAIEPYLRNTATEAHLATIVDEGEIRHASRPARGSPDFQRGAGDISGGRLPVGAVSSRSSVSRSEAMQQVVDEHRGQLQHLATEHLKGLPVQLHVEVARDVPAAIVALADRLEVNAIAIGTRGRTGLRRALLGSVAEEVIRQSHVPVFVVREGMRKREEGDDA